ncbi:MAG: flagellar hook-associated protein 3 [Acidobacteria bacterium]|nr:MAG: flagellar hook-associated protein 3 [Acidobacteriota bacterium]
MRVNPNYTDTLVNLLNQSQQNQTNALQELSTGRSVSKPSDDPSAEAAMIAANSRFAANDQYTANSDSLTQVLSTADSTLSSAVTILQRAISLGVEGANGTMNQTNLNSIAQEVSGIKDQMLSIANTSYAGQYLFAGTATGTAPYVVDATDSTTIDYVGNDQQNQVQVGTGLSVGANLPGSSIFSQSGANVFTALQSLITALRAGDSSAIATAQAGVSNSLDALNTARVFYGNTVNELTSNESVLSQEKVKIADYQNTLVSCDTATATTDVAQAVYQRNATVAAAAKMNQVSLLDYIK